MLFKALIAVLLGFMIYNLFVAMKAMLRNDPNQPSMTKFIGRRVLFSGLIILLVLLGILTGLITPNPRPY